MGVQISEIIPREEIDLKKLKGQVIAIDAFNTLYQFLTTIRQADGTPLMNSNGEVTSHLSGLFYRNIALLQEGIKPVYVFDGKPPELKRIELEKRKQDKELAKESYLRAKEEGDIDEMKKYAQRDVKITDKIIQDSKILLESMGIAVIQAKSEGEAEAALLARKRLVSASASQDYDSLLYGTPKLIRNLTLTKKRKTSAGLYVDTKIELIEFEKVLNSLQINKEQLICLAILVGTDYNPGGVKGIGQKRALEIVQRNQSPFEIFEYIRNSEKYEMNFDWELIFQQFNNFEEETKNEIIFPEFNEEKLKELMIEKNGFSEERINSGIEKIKQIAEMKKQKGLSDFI